MAERPTLKTERLVLRPFTLEDAPDTQRLAGAWEIADTTLTIPHPYSLRCQTSAYSRYSSGSAP